MSGYIYGIICSAVAIGIVELLVPERAKTRPYIKLLFSIALLLAVVKPLGSLAELIPKLESDIISPEQAPDYSQLSGVALENAYRQGVEAALRQEFDLKSFSVGVMLGEDNKPSRITVTLKGSDIFRNPYDIESFVSSAFSCPCITLIG